jgi:hypothetical protein
MNEIRKTYKSFKTDLSLNYLYDLSFLISSNENLMKKRVENAFYRSQTYSKKLGLHDKALEDL